MLVNQGIGAVLQNAELGVVGGSNAESVEQQRQTALTVRAFGQGQGNFIVRIAIAVQVCVADSTPVIKPVLPCIRLRHTKGIQPILAHHHGKRTADGRHRRNGIDVSVRRPPGVHAFLAHRLYNIRHQGKIIVQGDNHPVVGKIHYAEIRRVDDIRQSLSAGKQRRGHSGGIALAFLPVDSQTRAGHALDRRKIIASVKGRRAAVIGHAKAGDFKPVVKIQTLAVRKGAGRLQKRPVHVLHPETHVRILRGACRLTAAQ